MVPETTAALVRLHVFELLALKMASTSTLEVVEYLPQHCPLIDCRTTYICLTSRVNSW